MENNVNMEKKFKKKFQSRHYENNHVFLRGWRYPIISNGPLKGSDPPPSSNLQYFSPQKLLFEKNTAPPT